MDHPQSKIRADVILGARQSISLGLAVFAFGVSFGVIAIEVDLSSSAAIVMSATSFAGAAQFAAVTVVGSGGSVASAVFAGALLNVRFLPIGLDLAPAIKGSWWKRVLLSHLIVDESWAVSTYGRRVPTRGLLIGSGAFILAAWVGGTALGALAGRVFEPSTLGLDAAFPAVFLGLLVRREWDRHLLLVGLTSLAALLLLPVTAPGVPMLIATAIGVILGALR